MKAYFVNCTVDAESYTYNYEDPIQLLSMMFVMKYIPSLLYYRLILLAWLHMTLSLLANIAEDLIVSLYLVTKTLSSTKRSSISLFRCLIGSVS